MAINFPDTPSPNEPFFDSGSGVTYLWDQVSWRAQGISQTALVADLEDLSDVTISNLQDDNVLTYTVANGWHNAVAQGGSGGTGVPPIVELTGTHVNVPAGERKELNIAGYHAYALFKIWASVESWIRVYVDDATRDADIGRSEGNDPAPGSGVLCEVRTTAPNQAIILTPSVLGFNNDDPRQDTIYLSITNRTSTASAIQVKLTAVQLGEN